MAAATEPMAVPQMPVKWKRVLLDMQAVKLDWPSGDANTEIRDSNSLRI
jgi:hypothetical protein